jgi:hypothetical protein
MNDEYSQYVWEGMKEQEVKRRSKSRSKSHREVEKRSL